MKPIDTKLDEAMEVLRSLVEQVDEDCPYEHRTRHLNDALEEAAALVENYLMARVTPT